MKTTQLVTTVSAEILRFHVRNLSPGILMNPGNDPDFVDKVLRQKQPQQAHTDWTVDQVATGKIYRSEKGADGSPGRMGFPMQNLISSLVGAGQYVKINKKQISTAKSTILFEFLDFPEDFIVFKNTDKDGNVPWKPSLFKGNLDSGGKKTAVAIVRPRIPHWEAMFTLRLDTKRKATRETVIELVETAGRKIGLCDWRPTCKGRFGRFVITKIEVLQITDEKVETPLIEYETNDAPMELVEMAGLAVK
jgi:hypothetical protein